MKVVTIYNYPTRGFGPEHADYAERFVTTYRANPPLCDHKMIVVSNGGVPDASAVEQFSNIGGTMFLPRPNVGMDIGSYQFAAAKIECDLMVFFGGSSYFRKPGWLRRMVSIYKCYGYGLYGCTGNQGDLRLIGNSSQKVWPHVRTTGFWCHPNLINDHPFRVTDNSQRYEYEHGAEGLTTWAQSKQIPCWIAGWDCVKALHECDSMPGTFHNGTQHNLLVGDRLCAPPYYPHA